MTHVPIGVFLSTVQDLDNCRHLRSSIPSFHSNRILCPAIAAPHWGRLVHFGGKVQVPLSKCALVYSSCQKSSLALLALQCKYCTERKLTAFAFSTGLGCAQILLVYAWSQVCFSVAASSSIWFPEASFLKLWSLAWLLGLCFVFQGSLF